MLRLYHGTSSSNAALISTIGAVLPRKNLSSKGNWFFKAQLPSHGEMVYLSDNKLVTDFYSFRSTLQSNDRSTYSIVTVMAAETNLYPDENYFSEKGKPIYRPEMARNQSMIIPHKKKWKHCLQDRGLVCHRGPAKYIETIETKPITDNTYFWALENTPYMDLYTFDMIWPRIPFWHGDKFRTLDRIGDKEYMYKSSLCSPGLILRFS